MSAIPKKILAVQLRPASVDEAGLFYALTPGCSRHWWPNGLKVEQPEEQMIGGIYK